MSHALDDEYDDDFEAVDDEARDYGTARATAGEPTVASAS